MRVLSNKSMLLTSHLLRLSAAITTTRQIEALMLVSAIKEIE